MNYLPTCTSRLVVQHPCQVSFKSMQGCRRSWEDKLKCVKILSVKDHNSAKICQTWILPTCTSWLVVQHQYQVSFKSMQGCRRSWEDKLWCDGRTEWRKDGRTEWRTKQTLNAPLPFYGGGIIKIVKMIKKCIKASWQQYMTVWLVRVKRLQNFVNMYTECNKRNATV